MLIQTWVIDRFLINQNRLGNISFWLYLAFALSSLTFFFVLPDFRLIMASIIVAIFLSVLTVVKFSVGKTIGYALMLVFFVIFYLAQAVISNDVYEVVQLASLSLILYVLTILVVLRLCRYLNMETKYPDYVDQSIYKTLVFPDYGRGFDSDSLAKDAINVIVRIRKGNAETADFLYKLVGIIEEYKQQIDLTLGQFQQFMDKSNLEISKSQFNRFFG